MGRQTATTREKWSSAGRNGTGIGFLLVIVISFLGILTPAVQAEVVLSLDGSGTGSVTSSPSGIECSNTGGGPAGPACSHGFPAEDPPGTFEGNFVGNELTASPDSGSFFAGWVGDDPAPLGEPFGPICNSGNASPCFVIDLAEYGFEPIHITATFNLLPPPPVATTGNNNPGSNDRLIALEGLVNPAGSAVDDCRFEYGATTKYGASVPCNPDAAALGAGDVTEMVDAEVELEQLSPSTIYHYRLIASNVGGTGKGDDHTFTTAPATSSGCQNADIRDTQAFGAIMLPECMALEMVSPPQKGGQPATGPALSAGGKRVSFFSVAALGGTPGGLKPGGDPYVATRGELGWTTASTSPPGEIVRGSDNATALSFTPDFSRWFQIGSTQSQYQLGVAQAFQAGLSGLFSPFSPLLVPLVGGDPRDIEFIQFQGASADHSHLFFFPGRKQTAYLTGDPEPISTATETANPADHNTYIAQLNAGGQPSLGLLARDQSGKVWGGNCGTRLGGIRAASNLESTGERNQGAVSRDGTRSYFSTRPDQPPTGECDTANKLRIAVREENELGVQIEELFSSECDRVADPGPPAIPVCGETPTGMIVPDGNDYYQGASTDGSKVYFTTTRQLANTDLDTGTQCSATLGESEGCDLYLYDSTLPFGQRLIQVSAGEADAPGPGEEANVLNGLTAISGDGTHVYFVAQGILTTAISPKNLTATAGQPNLYVWDRETETTAFIGSLDSTDSGTGLWGGVGLLAVPELGKDTNSDEIGGDGHILVLRSKAALTADDSDSSQSDIFRYNSETKALERVSKAAPGGADQGAFEVTGGTNPATLGTDFAERLRSVSEDGETVLFSTDEGFVKGDINEKTDYYIWRSGQLYRLPGIAGGGMGLTHDGASAAFVTATPLLPQDGDTSPDVYVVRAGGGYPEPAEPPICQPDGLTGCQSPGESPAPAPGAGSANVSGPGENARKRPRCSKGKHHVKGRCVRKHPKPHRKHKKSDKAHHVRHANINRGAGK